MFWRKNGCKHSVVTSLCGGLGNQMFQYACGRALALKLGVELLLDVTWFESVNEGATGRRFQLDAFPHVKCRLASEKDIHNLTFRQRSFGDRLLRRPVIRAGSYIQEPNYAYWPGIEDVHAPAYLSGYWQNERYFAAHADDIRRDFTFPAFPSDEFAEMAGRIYAETHSVSVHIRRGDYVSNPVASEILGICSEDYYRLAVERIMTHTSSKGHLFLFSDDLNWVREHFETNRSAFTIVDHSCSAIFPWHDIHLMSLCRHHIIANSSFSWWGAWLSNMKGLIIAPQRWFADATMQHLNPAVASWITQ